MTLSDLTLALVRTTLATAAAACLAGLLLAILRVQSPRTHRIAWALVILQGWLLFPWTLKIETPPSTSGEVVQNFDSVSTPMTLPREFFDNGSADFAYELKTIPAPVPPLSERLAAPAIIAWFAGAAALALFAAWRYVRIVRTLPLGAAPDDPQWQAEWLRAQCRAGSAPGSARRFFAAKTRVARGAPGHNPGLKRTPIARLLSSPRVDLRITSSLGPLLAYIPWQYFILAPRTLWTALTSPERTAILRHELAHLRRYDLWKSLAIRAVALPQWFNPLVWLAVRRFDEAAEWSCDLAAAACGVARDENPTLTLANALLRTAELCPGNNPPRTLGLLTAVPANRRRSNLTRRIQRLVTPRFKEESIMKRLAVPVLLATIAAAQLIRIEYVAAENPPEERLSLAVGDSPVPAASIEEAVTLLDEPGSPTITASEFTERRRREFEARAKLPYVIEPPDILKITIRPPRNQRIRVDVKGRGAMTMTAISMECLVLMDGKINFRTDAAQNLLVENFQEEAGAEGKPNLGKDADLGRVFVAGMTLEQARDALRKAVADSSDRISNVEKVDVEVARINSKVCYIITKHGDGLDDVVRAPVPFPLNAENNVARFLKTTYRTLSHLKGAKIELRQTAPNGIGAEQLLPVAWDEANERPTPETNYPLLPGDRLFVRAPQLIRPPQIIKAADVLAVTFESAQGEPITVGDGDHSDATLTAKSVTLHSPVDAEGKIELRILWTKEVVAVAGMTGDQAASAIRERVFGPKRDEYAVKVAIVDDASAAPAPAPEPPVPVAAASPVPDSPRLGVAPALPLRQELYPLLSPITANTLPGRLPVFSRQELYPLLGPITSGAAIVSLDRPSDEEVMRVLENARPRQVSDALRAGFGRNKVRIVKEKVADYFDPPRNYPLVGRAQQHHAYYKCTIHVDGASEVFYIDHNHLNRLENVDAGAGDANGSAPPAATSQSPNSAQTSAVEVQLKWTPESWGPGEAKTSVPLTSGLTLGSVLKNLKLTKSENSPEPPTDFSRGIITLKRAVGPPEQGRFIERPFRVANHQLTSDDEPLQGGDSILIDLRMLHDPSLASAGHVQPSPLSTGVPTAAAAPAPKPHKLEFRIELIEDRTGDLGDFDALQRGPITIGDTNTTHAALRVFKKHKMIATLADPTIRTVGGRSAQFAVGKPAQGAKDGEPLFTEAASVELLAHVQPDESRGRGLLVDLKAREGDRKVEMTFPINEGQTAIVRLTSPNEKQDDNKKRAYIVVTPAWLD